MRARYAAAAVCALLGTASLAGHHSFGAFYFEDQSVSLEGNVVEFDYRNPHSWLHVSAADKSGASRRVSAEWASPGRLLQEGITKDTLKPGDRVILTGSPSRDQSEYKMHLKAILRPADGWTWAGLQRR
jgi:Family of unknown function (DUF6152)